jgi:hypothetical protein
LVEPDGAQTAVKLGLFVDNCRRRADKLRADRRAELDALGMRWQTAAMRRSGPDSRRNPGPTLVAPSAVTG